MSPQQLKFKEGEKWQNHLAQQTLLMSSISYQLEFARPAAKEELGEKKLQILPMMEKLTSWMINLLDFLIASGVTTVPVWRPAEHSISDV